MAGSLIVPEEAEVNEYYVLNTFLVIRQTRKLQRVAVLVININYFMPFKTIQTLAVGKTIKTIIGETQTRHE